MTLRALFFVSDLLGGGAQRTLLNLAAAMPRDSCQVELAIGGPDGPARRWIEPSLPVHDLGSDRLRRAVWPLARLIRARRPDIVLATMVDANVAAYAALRLAGVRSALALRETNSQRARGDIGAVRRWLSRFAYRRADLVIALSEGVRRELIADFALDPARTVTIGNPVNVAATAAAAADARARAAPWAARWSDPTVVAIGRLHRQKGFDILLAALADHTPPHARLVILGDGGDRAALEAEARRRGLVERVWFAGFVADPVPFLAHAAAFTLSSRWEGFGHVLVEAMAAGAPVVSTDCPHGPADIVRDRDNGLLVPTGDPAALGRAVATLLADRTLAARIAETGRASAARYEAATIARAYADTLAAAVTAKRARA